jgi:hypothetical protein
MKRTLQKASLTLMMATFLTALAIAPPALAWMGGGMDRGMMRGGGMCRMMDVTPQPVDPANLPEPSSTGAQVLKSKCTQCHGLISPRQHASQDWPYIVDRMDRRMRMMAGGGMGMMMRSDIQPLTQDEKNTLLSYLQQTCPTAALPKHRNSSESALSATPFLILRRTRPRSGRAS